MVRCLPLLLLVATGCELSAMPAPPLEVSPRASEALVLTQRATPIVLEYDVHGCEAFDAFALVASGASEKRVPLPIEKLADGGFSSEATADALKPALIACGGPALETELSYEIRLEIACTQDGRSAISAPMQVRYRVGPFFKGSVSPPQAVFPLLAAGTFAMAVPSYLNPHTDVELVRPGEVASSRPFEILREHHDDFFVFEGSHGGTFTIPGQGPTAMNAAEFRVWRGIDATPIGRYGLVPGSPVAISRLGEVDRVVSQNGPTVYFSRLIPGDPSTPGEWVAQVEAEADMEGFDSVEEVSFEGSPAFFTASSQGHLQVRRFDGSLATERTLPGSGQVDALAIKPDGTGWAVMRDFKLCVQAASGETVDSDFLLDASKLTWLSSGALVSYAGGTVTLHKFPGRSPGRRLVQPAEASAVPGHKVLKVERLADGAFAVLTTSGAQLFDADGKLVVGADPLPTACRQVLRPEQMAVIDGRSVVVATSGGALVLQLPSMP